MHKDNYSKNTLKVIPQNPLKFQCSQCGACCRRAGKSGFMPDRGDGACIHLTQYNTCSIYETRPDLCNMEKLWKQRNRELDLELRGISKKDYFIENSEACNLMIKQDQMNEIFKIDLQKYNEMEEQMTDEEKINGFDHNFDEIAEIEKNKNNELCCYHCNDFLVLTSIKKISSNSRINLRCNNAEGCGSIGFISRGILYQSEPSAD